MADYIYEQEAPEDTFKSKCINCIYTSQPNFCEIWREYVSQDDHCDYWKEKQNDQRFESLSTKKP